MYVNSFDIMSSFGHLILTPRLMDTKNERPKNHSSQPNLYMTPKVMYVWSIIITIIYEKHNPQVFLGMSQVNIWIIFQASHRTFD